MSALSMTFTTARKITLDAQLLGDRTKLLEGKEGIAQVIENLGYVQIDTIAVIKRAHHHTLWTRQSDYEEKMLHELQLRDRRVFEYWGHAMSYMPMTDYRYVLPRMRNFNSPSSKWAQYGLEKSEGMMQPVLERIKKEGPLGAKDFAPIPGTKSGTWWNWKPAKFALEMLYWKGDLMITERRNFQKIYDLTERVLPDDIDTRYPTDDELGQYFIRRALLAYGVAHERDIHVFMQPAAGRDADIRAANKEIMSKSLADLVDAGDVVRVKIDDDKNSYYFALSETAEKFQNLKESSSSVYLLSPFDNLMTPRDRTKRLFDFDYSLECYVPEAKRKYGYFVLPILWNGSFVGRLDPKADKKMKTLFIRNLVFEEQIDISCDFLSSFMDKLAAFARFNGCEHIKLEKISPVKMKSSLKTMIKKLDLG
ncbi:winged helix-turn-helix domain-containing protein [Acidobacteriota bacterium]